MNNERSERNEIDEITKERSDSDSDEGSYSDSDRNSDSTCDTDFDFDEELAEVDLDDTSVIKMTFNGAKALVNLDGEIFTTEDDSDDYEDGNDKCIKKLGILNYVKSIATKNNYCKVIRDYTYDFFNGKSPIPYRNLDRVYYKHLFKYLNAKNLLESYKAYQSVHVNIYSSELYKPPVDCIYKFNGIQKAWYAAHLDNYHIQSKEDIQAFLILTKDDKYLVNIEFDIYEFTFGEEYKLVGFYMCWVRRCNDTYNVCFVVQKKDDTKYFVYRDSDDNDFKAIRLFNENEYVCENEETEEEECECKKCACINCRGNLDVCICANCMTNEGEYYDQLSNYFNLFYDNDAKTKLTIMPADDIIKDATIVAGYSH
jgi:hypothetical protein